MPEQLPLQFEFRSNKTFADFFPAANQEVVTHLQQCIHGQGEQQILILGDSGLGKSHLLQACCHLACQQGSSPFYYELSSEHLNDIEVFNGIENYDVVCIDNIDCIAGQQDWELAFFRFFNQQRQFNHRLVISAQCLPNQLAFSLPDLTSRLNWGLTLKLSPLSEQDVIAALIFKASRMGFDISPSAGEFLLQHYQRNLQSLWDLLDTLDRATLVAQRKLTRTFLKEILDTQKSVSISIQK